MKIPQKRNNNTNCVLVKPLGIYLMFSLSIFFAGCGIYYPFQHTETKQTVYIPEPVPPPTTVREAFKLDPFYQQWIDVGGLPVIASAKVNPYALKEAAWLIRQMLQHREDILLALVKNGLRFVVIAHNEKITQIPEYDYLRPKFYWDLRARGLGARPPIFIASCGEENLLNYQGDPYKSNSILIHEFSHAIHLIGLKTVDPSFDKRLKQAFISARQNGLWKRLYAITNEEEYWAEGTQFWFNTGKNHHVKTRKHLKTYDSLLAALLAEVYGDTNWRYVPVTTRTGLPHLHGYNPRKSQKFEWRSFKRKFSELNKQLLNSYSDGGGKWVDLKKIELNKKQKLKSDVNNSETEIIFVNRTHSDIVYYWIDYDGNERYYSRVAPNYHIPQTTHVGHYWIVRDLNGNNLALFQANKKTGRAFVTIKAQRK